MPTGRQADVVGWKGTDSTGRATTIEGPNAKRQFTPAEKVAKLDEELARKDAVIAEITEEILKVKKGLWP